MGGDDPPRLCGDPDAKAMVQPLLINMTPPKTEALHELSAGARAPRFVGMTGCETAGRPPRVIAYF